MSTQHRSADLALTVFLAPMATGRRVLWLGDPASGGPERLAAYADMIRVLDTSGRARRRRRGAARVSLYQPGPLEFDPSSFDLAVIPDAAVVEGLSERLDELATIVGDGLVVAGVSTRRDEDARRLSESLLGSFREVRLLGQARFGGLALADLSSGLVDDVVVDGTLVGDDTEAIERVYGLAGDEIPQFEPYTVVQLSTAEEVTSVDQKTPREGLEDALANRSREVEALREALERAESRLERVQARLVSTEGELSEARAGLTQVSGEDEIAQLEAKLLERAQEVRALREEVDARGVIVRDLAEELREHLLGRRETAPASPEQLLDAEAARTEAELSRDEVRSELLDAQRAFETERAELRGRVRGLRARSAELAELREIAEARSSMLQIDAVEQKEHRRRLEAEVGELREQLEIAMIKARGAPAADSGKTRELEASEKRLSGRVGTLSGQLMRAREELAKVIEERDRARAETLRLTAKVSNLETRTEGMRLGYEMRIAMMSADAVETTPQPTGTHEGIERELDRLSEELEELRGEREGLRLRLEDREAALAAAQTRPVARADDAELKTETAELALRLAQLQEAMEREKVRSEDLSQALSSRDALITRLQLDLAQEEEAARLHDDQLRRAREETMRLREAVIDASNAVDARERAEEEAEGLRRQLVETQAKAGASQHKDAKLAADAQAKVAAAESAAASKVAAAESRVADAQSTIEELQSQLGEAKGQANAARGQLEEELREARRQRDDARTDATRRIDELQSALTALRDARGLLDGWRVFEEPREASEITAVGMDAPDDVHALSRDLENKDTLLRSLTAQLEERDDRIRALKRTLSEGGYVGTEDEMREKVMELEERAARLQEELRHERVARAATEADLDEARRRPDASAEIARLERMLGDREVALDEALSRAAVFERDVASLQEVVAQTRGGLEEMLSGADAALSERVGRLISLLGGF